MAGIGFELQKILRRNTLASSIQAFLYGSLIASGPMLLTILMVAMIGWLARGLLTDGPLHLFTVVVTYTFAFSLILTGPIQLLLTRFIADKDFARDYDALFPGFITASSLVVFLALVLSSLFYLTMEIYVPLKNPTLFRILGVVLFVGQCLIWQLMAFVSTSKEYNRVFLAYLVGAIIGIVAAFWGLQHLGLNGTLAAYGAGQWITLAILFLVVGRGYRKRRWWYSGFFRTFVEYPSIALNGLFLNLAIWIDKILFWAYLGRSAGASYLYSFNYYDVPNFLGLMTLIPGMAYFLIAAETTFYEDFRSFIQSVLKEPMLRIEDRKRAMLMSLRSGLKGMARIQGITALLVVIFASPILVAIGYQGVSIHLLRIMTLAAFLHIMNMTLNIFYLYFELRKEATLQSLFYFLTNASFTLLSIWMGPRFYGYGFLLAAVLTYGLFYPRLVKQVQRIDYLIFTSQPLGDVFVSKRRKKSLVQALRRFPAFHRFRRNRTDAAVEML